ncbi:MAG: hypothetical protein Q9166_007727 [cf. Caloplaca sp. 2 TL-2023]
MESLKDTTWDVVISGTGLPQSLLALALSRSGKRVLHIDQNDYYGGAEAALSLQEVETWVGQINAHEESPDTRLSSSRAYSISLSPHLIYTRSNLVPALVSSKVYRHLEFLAVGSWWIYKAKDHGQQKEIDEVPNPTAEGEGPVLRKIPGSREDVFADKSIDLRSTRSLMKVLKVAADATAYQIIAGESGDQSFPDFLSSEYKIDSKLQAPLQALTLSLDSPSNTSVGYALPRLHRHLTSIGIFGPGFGAVVPKWGGLAEVAQVACRAGAVGGGVYMLKTGIEAISPVTPDDDCSTITDPLLSNVKLQGGDEVKARWIIGTPSTLQGFSDQSSEGNTVTIEVTHLTAIISSPLTFLFPPPAEGSPPPASVIVVLPPGSVQLPKSTNHAEVPAIYLIVHSSDTGECPEGQSIIYTSTTLFHPSASTLLSSALDTFLSAVPNEATKPDILWSLAYKQHHTTLSQPSSSNPSSESSNQSIPHEPRQKCGVLHLQDLSPSLALEDDVLKHVRAVWERITADDGDARGGFMQFEDRESLGGEEEAVF